MHRLAILSLFAVFVMLSACATMPTGPSVMVLPGEGKSFDQFRMDDALCRQYAYNQTGGMAGQQAAENSAVKSAAVGTALGAVAGAIIGSTSGHAGTGAAIGAGSGLLLGSAAGSSYAEGSYYAVQRRYDYAYMQCMYAKGNQIPGYRRSNPSTGYQPSGRSSYPPPPPPDYSPPAE
ncbi:MAG: glycine zipper family protein [Nitrospiraceae bacterium]|nr:glycine zipper family protein [Nitrospiraceae bacterium]